MKRASTKQLTRYAYGKPGFHLELFQGAGNDALMEGKRGLDLKAILHTQGARINQGGERPRASSK